MPGNVLLIVSLLVGPARATIPLVESIGPVQALGVGGNWARAHAVTGADGAPGWLLTWANGGDLWAGELVVDGGSWTVDGATARRLTTDGRLVDHAITRCPDGTWLHVASLNLDAPDDSAWSFVYDADLRLLHQGPVEERNPTRAHNDMALICAEDFRGVTFPDFDARVTYYVPLDETGAHGEAQVLDMAPAMTGGSLVVDPATGWLTALGTEELVRLAVAQYDAELALVRYNPVELSHGMIGWWPQGLVAVGEGWLATYLAVPVDDPGRELDHGDVVLATLQDQLFQRTGHLAAAHTPPDGAGRPGLAYRDGVALVTFDHDNALFLVEAAVDPTGDPGPDTGEEGEGDDTGPAVGADSGADGGVDGGVDCGVDGGVACGVDGDGDGAEDEGEDNLSQAEPEPAGGCATVDPAATLVLLWPALLAWVGRWRLDRPGKVHTVAPRRRTDAAPPPRDAPWPPSP